MTWPHYAFAAVVLTIVFVVAALTLVRAIEEAIERYCGEGADD